MVQEEGHTAQSVLIVDDNVKNLQVLGKYLQREGLHVEFAIDGPSALQWLDRRKFDLILLDIMMPGPDGYEICYAIKNNTTTKEIPVIFMTSLADTENIVKGFDSGAVDYITKPFIHRELLARVRTHLKNLRSKNQIVQYLDQLREKSKSITESLTYASYIQEAILKSYENDIRHLRDYFLINLPKDVLSGDFLWYRNIDDNHIIATFDCTGHGVPGALMSILGVSLLNEIVVSDEVHRPAEILDYLSEGIKVALEQRNDSIRLKDGMEGAVITYRPGSGYLHFAGSFSPLLIISDGELVQVKADKIPVGYCEGFGKFHTTSLKVKKGDTVYLFTDGIIDQFGGPQGKRFMMKNLKELLLEVHDLPMPGQKKAITEKFFAWKGDIVQTDDVLVLGLRV